MRHETHLASLFRRITYPGSRSNVLALADTAGSDWNVTLFFQKFDSTAEQPLALFVISNGGPFVLRCGVGTEVKQSGKWRDPPEGRSFDFESVPLLAPRTATTIRVRPPSGSNTWRAVVDCERYCEDTTAGRRKRDFDWYVRKKAFIEIVRSESISQ